LSTGMRCSTDGGSLIFVGLSAYQYATLLTSFRK
jgi:hypothetical protein